MLEYYDLPCLEVLLDPGRDTVKLLSSFLVRPLELLDLFDVKHIYVSNFILYKHIFPHSATKYEDIIVFTLVEIEL